MKLPPLFLKVRKLAAPAIQMPLFCCLETSSVCTFQCKMCYVWKNIHKGGPRGLALPEWTKFISGLGKVTGKPSTINFTGAEPLCDPMTLEVIKCCNQEGFFTSMCTNAFLIDQPMSQRIAASGLNRIMISLDGIREETHDFLRGVKGSYEKAVKSISLLRAATTNLSIGIQTTILQQNLDEIEGIVEWCNADERISFINLQAIAQPFASSFLREWFKNKKYSFLWPQDNTKIQTLLDRLIDLKEKDYRKIANSLAQLRMFKGYFENPLTFYGKGNCDIDFILSVDKFGNLYLCRLKKPIGNIAHNTPEEIWFSKKAEWRRAEISKCRINCHLTINCGFREE